MNVRNFLKYVDTLVGNILKFDKNNTSLLVRFLLFFLRVDKSDKLFLLECFKRLSKEVRVENRDF